MTTIGPRRVTRPNGNPINGTEVEAEAVDPRDIDVNGIRRGETGFNHFNTKRANDKHRAESDAKAAEQARIAKWAPRRYAIADLAGRPEAWARKLAWKCARDNAARDPQRFPPTLIFKGDAAVKAGATDEQLTALTELSNEQIMALKIEEAAIHRSRRDEINTAAKRITAARDASALSIPDPLNLATFVPPDTVWVVDGLIPAGASLGLFAERKAGKTSTMVELSRALLTGEAFLGRFDTRLPGEGRVVVLDTEMTATMLHEEYTRAGVPLDRLDVWVLRGKSSLLDLRDPANRARWREKITPGSFIIVDCLYTILAALTIDENSAQVADVIEGIKTLAVECEAAGWVLVHHVGKDSARGARGHSSIEGAVDTAAWLHLEGQLGADTERSFEAVGRHDVNVPRAQIVRGEDRRLTLGDTTPKGERRRARNHNDEEIAYEVIAANPGLSMRGLERLPAETLRGLSRGRLRVAVERLAQINDVVNLGTDGAPRWHPSRGSDPFGTAVPETAD